MTVLRDKNTKQALELQRLKMKLQVAAELKGVSVDDLTAAFEKVAMRDMDAEIRARLKDAERRARKAELSKEEALALSYVSQKAGSDSCSVGHIAACSLSRVCVLPCLLCTVASSRGLVNWNSKSRK